MKAMKKFQKTRTDETGHNKNNFFKDMERRKYTNKKFITTQYSTVPIAIMGYAAFSVMGYVVVRLFQIFFN